MTNKAFTVPCRRCGAHVGERCWDLTTTTREFHTKHPHLERKRAATVAVAQGFWLKRR